MNPATFPGADILYGDEQPQYLLLPAMHKNGSTVVCFEATPEEMRILAETGRVFLEFHVGRDTPVPLLPMRVLVVNPLD